MPSEPTPAQQPDGGAVALKPCPFDANHPLRIVGNGRGDKPRKDTGWVRCCACGFGRPSITEWNTRAPIPPASPEREAVYRAVDAYLGVVCYGIQPHTWRSDDRGRVWCSSHASQTEIDALRERERRLREAINAVTLAGGMMANICFNGKQLDRLPADYRKAMADCQARWDRETQRLAELLAAKEGGAHA